MQSLPRLNRLFAPDGKCFDLAIDHGAFNEYDFLAGIEDMGKTVAAAIEAGPDAIQLSPGQAHFLQDARVHPRPALVMRADTANIYARETPRYLFAQTIAAPVETALRLDAACVIVNLFYMPDRAEFYHQCIQNVCAVKTECERFGMPLMVEPLVMLPGKRSAYESDGNVERLVPLVRQAAELGADIIKCDPTVNSADFHRVVEAAGGRPVLARGGARMDEAAILMRTWELMQEGAAGIVYGRNVLQHPHPRRIMRAFLAVVHEGATAESAARLLEA
jgi:DhnA family fructose-bisphosphate aldolase class Ia